MSLADPLTITYKAASVVLPRTGDTPDPKDDGSVYRSSDGLVMLTASHNYGKRTRRVLRIDVSKITADPFKPAENVKVSMSNYIVFDLPPAGYTSNEAWDVWDALRGLVTANSGQVVAQLLGGNS